jgi:hypothetical protein
MTPSSSVIFGVGVGVCPNDVANEKRTNGRIAENFLEDLIMDSTIAGTRKGLQQKAKTGVSRFRFPKR